MFWNKKRPSRKAQGAGGNGVVAESGISREVPLTSQDTRAAIDELSSVVKDNPEAVEIYLALGSLYRSQGEIERAIQIRNNLIVRPRLDAALKARAWFELGRDFLRGGFLDRAAHALEQARSLSGDRPEILHELARHAAQAGEYEKAAALYSELGQPLIEAHYLVRYAGEKFEAGETATGNKLLKRAFKVYPGSVEAWLERIVQAWRGGEKDKLPDLLRTALTEVPAALRFVILEGVIGYAAMGDGGDENDPARIGALRRLVIPVLESMESDVLLYYYGARIFLRDEDREKAREWLDKALVLNPDFWHARLDIFELSCREQQLSPVFKEQLDFFTGAARKLKRFHCRQCGLRRDAVFFVCPRCRSWHSIAVRMEFSQ